MTEVIIVCVKQPKADINSVSLNHPAYIKGFSVLQLFYYQVAANQKPRLSFYL